MDRGGGPGLKALADRLLPLWIAGGPYRRLFEAAYRVRLLIAASAFGTVWALPGASRQQRVDFLWLLGLVYLPFAIAIYFASRRSQGTLLRVSTVLGDVFVVFLFQALLPPTRVVALLGYLLILAFYSYLGGIWAGIFVGSLAFGLTIVAQFFGQPAARLDTYTLVMFGAVLASMAVLLDAATKEQRRAAQRLSNLHDSLRVVSSSNELPQMFDAVTKSVKEALHAAWALVALKGDDGLLAASIVGFDYNPSYGPAAAKAVETYDSSPASLAMHTGQPVVTQNLKTDPKFSQWAQLGESLGCRSAICAPMSGEEGPFGVLVIAFDSVGTIKDDMVDLAVAFAEQASAGVTRAMAFRREREAVERLKQLDGLKQEFLANVSHELRTPLTSIEGFADTLLRRWDQLPGSMRFDFLKRIARNTFALHRLVEQVLDLSRLDLGPVEVTPKRIRLRNLVATSAEAYAPALEDHVVVVDIPDDLEVHADRDAVERIISNLLTNAAKFSPTGTSITVKAEAEGMKVLISVHDDGIGIPEEDLPKIFDSFYRATNRLPIDGTPARGTGIGLSVAKRYVEMHGGTIWVTSQPGHGSIFYFTLPALHIALIPPKTVAS